MTETIENGLLDLEQRTSQNPRRTPPPRHPKRPVEVPPPSLPVTSIQPKAPEVVDVREEALGDQGQSTPDPAPRGPSPLRATQVYLDGENDDFLRRCSAAGLIKGSRDVTNSGVIRFALCRLAAEMAPDEVALAMLDGNSALRRPGRKRV